MATRAIRHAWIVCLHTGVLWVLPSWAADGWGGSVAVTTDYIYRGVSQTRGDPAAQGGVRFQSRQGWNAGLWGSSIDFNSGAGASYEIDLQAGYAWSIDSDWAAQLAFVHYEYPNDGAHDYDYDELGVSLSFQQRVTASVSYSPNTSRWGNGAFVQDKRALAYELAMLQPLGAHWSLCAGVGYYDLRGLFDTGYWFWNTGVAFTWDAIQVDLLHIDTDSTAERLFGYGTGGRRWTAALSWRF